MIGTCHIGKGDTGLLLHVDLRLALADPAESAHAAHPLRHRAHQQREQAVHDHDRQQPGDDEADDRTGFFRQLAVVLHALLVELVCQRRRVLIRNQARVIELLCRAAAVRVGFLCVHHAVVALELQLADLTVIQHRQKFVVPDLGQIGLGDRRVERVDQQRRDQRRQHQKQDSPAFDIILIVVIAVGLLVVLFWIVAHGSTFLPSRGSLVVPVSYHTMPPFTRTGKKQSVNFL